MVLILVASMCFCCWAAHLFCVRVLVDVIVYVSVVGFIGVITYILSLYS